MRSVAFHVVFIDNIGQLFRSRQCSIDHNSYEFQFASNLLAITLHTMSAAYDTWVLKFSISLMADWGPVGMWMKPGKPVGNPCGQARGQAKPVHRLSISGCPRAERSEPGVRAAIIHISTGPGVSFCSFAHFAPR